MPRRFGLAPRNAAFAVLLVLLPPIYLSAWSCRPSGQSGAQKKDALIQESIPPPDSVIVPDATPLKVDLLKSLSSATAKVGDLVSFSTHSTVRIDGLVVLPIGAEVSGKVVFVSRPRRASRGGRLNVVIEKVVLPSGETANLRPDKPENKGKKIGEDALLVPLVAVSPEGMIAVAAFPVVVPIVIFMKGDEKVYPAGSQFTVFFNGPLNLDRAALLKLQPPPYKGPAQIFYGDFNNGYLFSQPGLFCGQERIGETGYGDLLRVELNPGTYWFSTEKKNDPPLQLELKADHQYWFVRTRKGLIVRDIQQVEDQIANTNGVIDRDFSSPSAEEAAALASVPPTPEQRRSAKAAAKHLTGHGK